MAVYLTDEVVASQLSMAEAVGCVDTAFRELALGSAMNAVRTRMDTGPATLNVMWGCVPSTGLLGVKSYVTAGPGVTRGAALMLTLYAMESGEMVAQMEANRLGQLRTGAASAVATRAMANQDPRTLSVYGTGFQAGFQVHALLDTMKTITRVCVVGRNETRRDAFIRRLAARFGHVQFHAANAKDAASSADIVVAATNAQEPLFDADWIRPGTHINAVGSNAPHKRELDRGILDRAALILVDDRDVARKECGDLLVNRWDVSNIETLGDLLVGKAAGRSATGDITIFESQGLAVQDIACASVVVEHALKQNLGIRLK